MFEIIKDPKSLAEANKCFREALFSQASKTGGFWVTYPSGKEKSENGAYLTGPDLWAGFSNVEGSRWWNGFNAGNPYTDSKPKLIAVEVNIPHGSQGNIQGVALKDDQGRTWIGHRGRLGGNAAAIGAKFLEWYPDGTTTVKSGSSTSRVIVIGRVEDPDLHARLRRFVDCAVAFKAGKSTLVKKPVQDSFNPEFRGEKAVAIVESDYTSVNIHGAVVDALRRELKLLGIEAFNDAHRDLYTGTSEEIECCFEVKTSTATTDCYTGIGQLFVHGKSARCRILVLPAGACTLEDKLGGTGVHILRYMPGADPHYFFNDLAKAVTAR